MESTNLIDNETLKYWVDDSEKNSDDFSGLFLAINLQNPLANKMFQFGKIICNLFATQILLWHNQRVRSSGAHPLVALFF